MGSIDRGDNSFAAGQGAEFLGGQHHSGEGGDVAEEQNSGARGDGVADQIQHLRGIFYRLRQRDLLHHDAVALGAQVPRVLASGMLLIGHQHFVAGLQIDAVGDVAVGLGGISEEGDLVAVAADERRQRIAKLVPGGVSPDGIVLGIGLVQLLARLVAFKHGAQHGRGARAYGAVIEVDFVGGNQELLAQFAPVGVFVLVEQGAVGQL